MNIHLAHDPILVTFALAIAFLAAFTSFNLATRAQESETWASRLWLFMAAVAMGGGIFTMHFIAMLACDMGELFIEYRLDMIVAALAAAIICCGVALWVVLKLGNNILSYATGGLIMGLGIVAMHFIGERSMVLAAIPTHNPRLVILSTLIAMTMSPFALWLGLNLRGLSGHIGGALLVAGGIGGVHFVGIGATFFEILPDVVVPPNQGLPPGILAIVVGAAAIVILAIALTAAIVDQHLSRRAVEEAARLREARDQLEVMVDERTRELRTAVVEAEAANLAKSRFLANMSHELRTPFNAILGYAQILQMQLEDSGNEQAVQNLEYIRISGEHVLGMVNELLELSKIESGSARLSPSVTDLGSLIDSVAVIARPQIEERGNAFRINVANDAGYAVVDVQKTRQCLINLLSNAAKFTSSGDVALGVSRDGENIVFEVSDTGIGIAEIDQERIFDAFVQGDDSVTKSYQGAGLGLAITRHFVHLMGGGIDVDSAEGRGSTFRFWVKADQMPLTNLELKTNSASGHVGIGTQGTLRKRANST